MLFGDPDFSEDEETDEVNDLWQMEQAKRAARRSVKELLKEKKLRRRQLADVSVTLEMAIEDYRNLQAKTHITWSGARCGRPDPA